MVYETLKPASTTAAKLPNLDSDCENNTDVCSYED